MAGGVSAGGGGGGAAPLQFCPLDGNLLLVAPSASGSTALAFACSSPACGYRRALTGRLVQDVPLVRKQVDDVLGGDEAWENVDKTLTKCPQCAHNEAYYMQVGRAGCRDFENLVRRALHGLGRARKRARAR